MARSKCDYIANCGHERAALARRKECALESRVLVSAGRLRDLKAAPEDIDIEAIEPIERAQGLFVELENRLAESLGKGRKKAATPAPSVSNNPERPLTLPLI